MKRETVFDKTRGIKARLKYRMCEHGKVLIDNYEPKDYCSECFGGVKNSFYIPNTEPFFNHGLGCVTHGTRHAEKIAKSRGLEPIGDTLIRR